VVETPNEHQALFRTKVPSGTRRGGHVCAAARQLRWAATSLVLPVARGGLPGPAPPAERRRCCCRTDSCASALQPLTGDRVIDRTYVGHQAPTNSSFCSPVHNTWANGMRPHCPPSSVLVQHTSKGVGARNSALCDCVCTYVSACVCVCTVCVHCVCALCVCVSVCVCVRLRIVTPAVPVCPSSRRALQACVACVCVCSCVCLCVCACGDLWARMCTGSQGADCIKSTDTPSDEVAKMWAK
jgi:hypothetical protein